MDALDSNSTVAWNATVMFTFLVAVEYLTRSAQGRKTLFPHTIWRDTIHHGGNSRVADSSMVMGVCGYLTSSRLWTMGSMAMTGQENWIVLRSTPQRSVFPPAKPHLLEVYKFPNHHPSWGAHIHLWPPVGDIWQSNLKSPWAMLSPHAHTSHWLMRKQINNVTPLNTRAFTIPLLPAIKKDGRQHIHIMLHNQEK